MAAGGGGGAINIGTAVNTAGFRSGMASLNATARSELQILQALYRETQAAIKDSSDAIIENQAKMAAAMGRGSTQAAAQFQAAIQTEVAALDIISEREANLRGEIAALNVELNNQANSFRQTGIASRLAAVELGAPGGLAYGIGMLASQSKVAQAIMSAAFPMIGFVAAGEIIYDVGKKVHDLYERFIELKDIELEVEAVSERLAKNTSSVYDKINQDIIRSLRESGHLVEAAKRGLLDVETKPIDISNILNPKEIESKFGDYSKKEREDLKKAFQGEVDPYNLSTRLDFVKGKIKELDEQAKFAKKSLDEMGEGFATSEAPSPGLIIGHQVEAKSNDLLFKVYNDLRMNLEAQQHKYKEDLAKGNADIVKATEDEGRKAAAAHRQMLAEMKRVDTENLDDMKADHRLSVTEIIQYWESRLAAESQYKERVRDIMHQLGTLYQDQDKATEEHFNKSRVRSIEVGKEDAFQKGGRSGELEYLKKQAESLKADVENGALGAKAALDRVMADLPTVQREANNEVLENVRRAVNDEYEIWVGGTRRTLTEMKRYWEEVATFFTGVDERIASEAIKHLAQINNQIIEESRRLADLKKAAETSVGVGGLEQQRAQVQRSQALDIGANDPGAKIRVARQMMDIDRQEAAVRVQAQQDATDKIAALYGKQSPQYQSELNKLVDMQKAADAKMYQDTTNLLVLQQQRYVQFFNTVNQGFTRAIDGMLTGTQTFGRGMQQLWTRVALDFDNMLIEMALHWAEKAAMRYATELGLQTILKILHIGTAKANLATDVAAQTASVTAHNAGNLVMATSDAGLAAAGQFAWYSSVYPPIAPAMAAAAYAEGLGFASLASYDVGGIIPNTGIALVHEGEHVTTAPVTRMLTNIANGGGVGTTQQTNNHFHGGISVQAPESTDPREFADNVWSAIKHKARLNGVRL